jgi:hypothetical protein
VYLCTPFQQRLIGIAEEEVKKFDFFRLKFGKSEKTTTFALPIKVKETKSKQQ